MVLKRLAMKRQAVITVGKSRGFIVSARNDPGRWPYVVTAAHCLPSQPPADSMSDRMERTHCNLLGPLGESPHISAQCVFADPVADIAVLTEPDSETLSVKCDAWRDFIGNRPALRAAAPRAESFPGYVMTLDDEWDPCRLTYVTYTESLCVEAEGSPEVQGGMSGSPILDQSGNAIGVISVGAYSGEQVSDAHGQACLYEALPGWFARCIGLPTRRIKPRSEIS